MMVAISTSICYECVNEVHPLREGYSWNTNVLDEHRATPSPLILR
jgi:hypothetical protein